MDKQLLAALNKTSDAIEALAEALNSKEKSTSASASALKSGDFGAQLKSINASLKSIKKDTQEILRQQKTIQSMSQKSSGEKDDPTSKIPTDKKKNEELKKGLGMILLIAVAVLAIGLALKIVGKVDFLSVISLGLAITIIAIAFSKVAALKLTMKETMIASTAMVAMSIAITASSWILKKIQPIVFTQVMTGIIISMMFAIAGKGIGQFVNVLGNMGMGKIIKSLIFLPLIMPAIALGITLSSWILKGITPIGFGQALTAILISAMFSVLAFGMKKMLTALDKIGIMTLAVKIKFLPKIMAGIAAGITFSSWILKLITPISFGQAITGILIAAMFAVVSMNLPKLVKAVRKMNESDAIKLSLILPAVASAITASSFILSIIKPITFGQFATALAIAIVFIPIAYAVSLISKSTKKMKWSDVAKLPVLFTLLATAITISSHILSEMKPIPFSELLRLLVFSAVLSIALVVISVASWVVMKLLKNVDMAKNALKTILVLAAAISGASLIISIGKYDIYPGWKWSLFTGIALLAYGLVGWVLTKIGKVKDYIAGALIIVVIAGTIALASNILKMGDYTKGPNMKWVLATAAGILAYGLLALAFGIIAMSGVGAIALLAGAGIVLALSGIIVGVSLILNKGDFTKFPSVKWNLGVIATLGSFGALSIVLGTQVLNPFFYAGFLVILALAKLVVKTAEILAMGKYDLKGFAGWTVATVLLFSTFAPLILVLGAVAAASAALGFFTGINPFEMGKAAFISIAETIVDVSFILKKGTYSGGPTYEWARGISVALGAFAPIYKMLINDGIMKAFGGGGVGPEDFKKAIRTVSEGIVDAAQFFAANSAAFVNGPPIEWAKGVGRAIGAFAPVFKVLQEGKGWFGDSGMEDVQNMKSAIRVICEGIVEAAGFFAKNTSPFQEGKYPDPKWGKGVGSAIKAFAPVFAVLSATPWYRNPAEQIKAMKNGIVWVAEAIVEAGKKFQKTTPDMWQKDKVPTKEWARGVSTAIKAFTQIFKIMSEESGVFTSGEEVVRGLATGIKIIAESIASAGIALSSKGAGIFKTYPDLLWGTGVKMAVQSYLGIFDLLTAKKMTPEVFSKTAKTLEGGVISMSNVARILFSNSRFFTFKLDPSFVKNISGNLIEFAKLGILLDKMLVTIVSETSKSGGLFGIGGTTTTTQKRVMKDMGIVDKVAQAMANTASILFKNKNLFSTKIDPNFMKKLGRNVLDYVGLAMYLSTKQAEIATITEEGNPIDKIANSMITLATGYDRLAAALERYAKAVAMVISVTGKPPKTGAPGIKKGPSESSGGPSGMKREGQSEAQEGGMNKAVKSPKKLSPLESDIKVIIKHLDKMTKEGDSAPGLLRRILDMQQSTNFNLIGIMDEIEEMRKKKKKEEE